MPPRSPPPFPALNALRGRELGPHDPFAFMMRLRYSQARAFARGFPDPTGTHFLLWDANIAQTAQELFPLLSWFKLRCLAFAALKVKAREGIWRRCRRQGMTVRASRCAARELTEMIEVHRPHSSRPYHE